MIRQGGPMVLMTLGSGDPVHRFDGTIAIPFKGRRKVLSTSPLNGGYREDLTAVFNHDGLYGTGAEYKMKAPTYREHMMVTVREIGLDVNSTTGLETAAQMENVAIESRSHEDVTVTAIVTGGADVNGGRVGDAAGWVECAEHPGEYRPGTINILLYVDADLSPGCMARALVTLTEAKTAALQELMAESRYSRGLATGTGTDGVIVIANAESSRYLTEAGKHSKLGELIGRAVMAAVKRALKNQTGLDTGHQHDALRRMARFGVTEAGLYHQYAACRYPALGRPEFAGHLERVARSGRGVVLASLLAHLIDQMDWGLIAREEALDGARALLMGTEPAEWLEPCGEGADAAAHCIARNWSRWMCDQVAESLKEGE